MNTYYVHVQEVAATKRTWLLEVKAENNMEARKKAREAMSVHPVAVLSVDRKENV